MSRRICLARRRRVGAALVEFAVVLPIFMLVLLGIFEFGRAFMVYQVLVNSSRAAARRAVISKSTTETETAARDQVRISGLPETSFAVSYKINGSTAALSTAKRGDAVGVQVSIPFSNVAVVAPMFLGAATLNGETIMRCE